MVIKYKGAPVMGHEVPLEAWQCDPFHNFWSHANRYMVTAFSWAVKALVYIKCKGAYNFLKLRQAPKMPSKNLRSYNYLNEVFLCVKCIDDDVLAVSDSSE